MAEFLFADDFKTAGGTVASSVADGMSRSEESVYALWARSEAAKRFQGFWVLLNAALEPRDMDLSPSALRERHATPAEGEAVVFVPATTVQLGV